MPEPFYEDKKIRVNLSLTPSTVLKLDSWAAQMKISRSQVVEQWVRLNDDDPSLEPAVLNKGVTNK